MKRKKKIEVVMPPSPTPLQLIIQNCHIENGVEQFNPDKAKTVIALAEAAKANAEALKSFSEHLRSPPNNSIGISVSVPTDTERS
jgi:hypothetical protein